MCVYCKNSQYKDAARAHTVCLDDNVLVITHVPCQMCTCCGETFYSDEVVKKLDEIVSKAKEMFSAVNIIDYRKVA